MNARIKVIMLIMLVTTTVFSGCKKEKEIVVSDNVKESVVAKVEDNRPKNQPELKRSLKGLEGKEVLSWIDDNNLLVKEQMDEKVILYSYSLEKEELTEILNKDDIRSVFGTDSDVALVGNHKHLFEFNVNTKKLKEILNFDEEFKDGVPGAKAEKEKQGFGRPGMGWADFIQKGYIYYFSKLNYDDKGRSSTAEYTILDYKNNKKYSIESRYSCAPIDCKLDFTGKNMYIGEFSKLTKLNLESGEITSMPLSMPKVLHVYEDGSLFVICLEENGSMSDKIRYYKVDFDNKKVTKCDEKYEGRCITINRMDFKNKFFTFTKWEEKGDKNTIMYGIIEDNKLTIKGKLIEQDKSKYKGCINFNNFEFSPDHNRFIASIVLETNNLNSEKDTIIKDDKYLFELK